MHAWTRFQSIETLIMILHQWLGYNSNGNARAHFYNYGLFLMYSPSCWDGIGYHNSFSFSACIHIVGLLIKPRISLHAAFCISCLYWFSEEGDNCVNYYFPYTLTTNKIKYFVGRLVSIGVNTQLNHLKFLFLILSNCLLKGRPKCKPLQGCWHVCLYLHTHNPVLFSSLGFSANK
jgi:hypothetical protein